MGISRRRVDRRPPASWVTRLRARPIGAFACWLGGGLEDVAEDVAGADYACGVAVYYQGDVAEAAYGHFVDCHGDAVVRAQHNRVCGHQLRDRQAIEVRVV